LWSVSGVRGTIDAIGNSQNDECHLQQNSPNENAHKETHNSCDKDDQPLGGGLLEAQDNVSDDADAAGENPNDIEKLHEAARELLLKGEVEKGRKEVLIVGHVASWQSLDGKLD
jgi:hypothetical protein